MPALVIGAGLALGLLAPAAHSAPMILLLHGGGWQTGDSASMDSWRVNFQARGYRTTSVEYPLGRIGRSIEFTERIAQRERLRGAPVIAYGISAGGTIAAALAANGAVDGAVNIIGPTDFTTWASPAGIAIMLAATMTAAEKRSASPYWRLSPRAAPQLLQCGEFDPVTPYSQCERYVAGARVLNSDTTLQKMLNAHEQSTGERDRALAWIQTRWPVSTSWKRPSRPAYLGPAARPRLGR